MYPNIYKTFKAAYLSNLSHVYTSGTYLEDGTKELRQGLSFILSNPLDRTIGIKDNALFSSNVEYLHAFWEHIIYNRSIDTLVKMNPNAAFATEHDGRSISYGPRIRRQVDFVISELRNDPLSRRACIIILSEEDNVIAKHKRHSKEKIEYPCTFAMQYFIREDKLFAHAVMRSNCVVSVILVDVYMQTMLQELIANELNIGLGTYQHTSVNSHIPSYQLTKAEAILERYLHA